MIKRELSFFLLVGLSTVFIDYAVYNLLLWSGWVKIGTSKAVSFLVGTFFSYFANKLLTFGHLESVKGSLFRFALLYMFTLGCNVGVNDWVLDQAKLLMYQIEIAFITATFASASLNFLGMKS